MATEPRQNVQQVRPEQAALSGEILETLNSLPPERRRQFEAVLVSQEHHRGPLPDPRTFAGYEAVLPGSAREIMDMAIRQQNHAITMQERALGSEISYRGWTLVAASIVVLAMIAGAIILGVTGHDDAAAALGAASGAALVAGAFLKGRDLFPKPERAKSVPAQRRQPKVKVTPKQKR